MTERISRAVLVTGCSTGIGRATALRLARVDARVLRTWFPTPRPAEEASR
jgi:NAD(P)-dependent dehydrogenase (short-subunit alcohol dehydrogenase family)